MRTRIGATSALADDERHHPPAEGGADAEVDKEEGGEDVHARVAHDLPKVAPPVLSVGGEGRRAVLANLL